MLWNEMTILVLLFGGNVSCILHTAQLNVSSNQAVRIGHRHHSFCCCSSHFKMFMLHMC